MGVRGHDQVGVLGNRVRRHQLGVLEDVDFIARRLRGQCQPIVRRGRDDARELDALLLAQRLENLGAKIARPDQCALHCCVRKDLMKPADSAPHLMCDI
jgi:hypothetical protein